MVVLYYFFATLLQLLREAKVASDKPAEGTGVSPREDTQLHILAAVGLVAGGGL